VRRAGAIDTIPPQQTDSLPPYIPKYLHIQRAIGSSISVVIKLSVRKNCIGSREAVQTPQAISD
jgi:hypothetical protein